MGTTYVLYKTTKEEVEIHEMSNKLSLYIDSAVGAATFQGTAYTKSLEPITMLKLLMEGIKVTSYYLSKEEYEEVFSKLEVYPY